MTTRRDSGHRRPIAIWGAYGGWNIGDEAILSSMVSLLRNHDLNPRTVVIQHKPEPEVQARYSRLGLDTVPFSNAFRLIRTLFRHDLICGGGQLLDDRGGLGFPAGFTGVLILVNRALGGKPVLFGIGAEPVSRRATMWLVRRLYALARIAMVRDKPSAEALRTAGYPDSRIRVAGDVVLTEIDWECEPSSGKNLMIVPNKDSQRAHGLGDILSTIAQAARRSGWSVTVMAHDRRDAYDAGEVSRLHSELGDDDITYIVPASLDNGLEQYRRSSLVVSARMHPLIMALLHGSAVLAIPAVPKVETLVTDLDLPSMTTNTAPEAITSHLDKALEWDLENARRTIAERRRAIGESLDEAIRSRPGGRR